MQSYPSPPQSTRKTSVIPTTVLNLEAVRAEAQRRMIRKLAEALDVEPRDPLAG